MLATKKLAPLEITSQTATHVGVNFVTGHKSTFFLQRSKKSEKPKEVFPEEKDSKKPQSVDLGWLILFGFITK